MIYLIPGMFGAPLKALAGYFPPQETIDFDINRIVRDNAKEIMKSGVQVGGTQGAASAASNEPVKYSDFLHLPHGLDGYFDYDQALKYADLALQADARLVDYSTEMYYGNEQNSSQGPLQVPYLWWEAIYDPSVKLEWAEFYYQYFLSASCAYFCPSREMLKLYDKENDLRYKYLMCENFSWRHNIKYTYPGYVYFRTSIPYGTTVQEMILTKAECLARQGKFQQAMETVNILRAKRIAPGPEVKLSAATKEEAIAKILEERVRELTWGLRWFDIRRLNYNETTLDDVNLKRIFYSHDGLIVNKESQPIEYRLELKDRRFAEPINSNEIYLSRGQIQQNT